MKGQTLINQRRQKKKGIKIKNRMKYNNENREKENGLQN